MVSISNVVVLFPYVGRDNRPDSRLDDVDVKPVSKSLRRH